MDEKEQQEQTLQSQSQLDAAWDNLCINPHQAAHEEGRRRGRQDGWNAGYQQGYRLGRTTALDYGMEIGFVRGVAMALQHDVEQQQQQHDALIPEDKKEKIQRALASLYAALDDFPGPSDVFREPAAAVTALGRAAMQDQTNRTDDAERGAQVSSAAAADTDAASLDVAGKFQRIRARFKLLTVHLGIPHFSLKQVMDEAAAATNASKEKTPDGTSEW